MLEPVHVGGVTVSTATLHNEEDLARKDVREGDEVVVTRAGDVIPQVIAPLIQRRKGKRLRKAEAAEEVPDRAAPRRSSPRTRCGRSAPTAAAARARHFQLVKHFRGAMDIEGLGEKNAMRFLDEGLITDPASIYDLTAERIAELEGFGETSAQALIAEIERSKQQPVRARPLRARAARDRLRQRRARSPSTSARSTPCSPPTPSDHRGRRDRPGARRAAREELADEAVLELIARLRERGLRFELSEAERRAEGGPLEGKTLRAHRHAAER